MQGAFEVAQLKGNIGGQNYLLPADLDLSTLKSVVIYCRRFTRVFSTAGLVFVGGVLNHYTSVGRLPVNVTTRLPEETVNA